MNINFRGQNLLERSYDFLQQGHSESKPIKVMVHDFIQTVVFTPFPQDGELQVERLTLAGNIYESIGFRRKAAFYRRFAALKAVTVQPNWQACYDSLLLSLEDFGLTLDPIEYEKALSDKCRSVWPSLHIQLIEELVTCCRKIPTAQAGTLAIRHMSFMLHSLDFYLSPAKKLESAKDLEEVSTVFGEDSPVPLKLDSGFVIPTVNLTKFPLCLKLEPQPLPVPLRPIRLTHLRRRSTLTPKAELKSDNPFIFTPIASHNSMSMVDARQASSNSGITGVVWVQDEPCHTMMVLKNTLPFDLKVSSISLLADGVPLETKPYSLVIPPGPNSTTTIQLIAIPRQSLTSSDDIADLSTSKIDIFGYSTHLLGVKSNCRLDIIPKSKFPSQYTVDVSPPLPKIDFQFSHVLGNLFADPIPLDQVGVDLLVMEVKVNLLLDTKLDTTITILNSSNVDLHYLHIQEQKRSASQSDMLVSWNEELVDGLVTSPLKAGQKFELPIVINACEAIFKSSKLVSKALVFEYSGCLALKEMFCRKCAIKFSVELDTPAPVESKPTEGAAVKSDDVPSLIVGPGVVGQDPVSIESSR